MDGTDNRAPSLLTKLGVLAGGLACLGFFAAWPVYRLSHGEESVSISFKGILLGAILTTAGLSLLLFGEKGIPWKKSKDQPVTGFQRLVIVLTMLAALALTAGVWFFLRQQGYEIKF